MGIKYTYEKKLQPWCYEAISTKELALILSSMDSIEGRLELKETYSSFDTTLKKTLEFAKECVYENYNKVSKANSKITYKEISEFMAMGPLINPTMRYRAFHLMHIIKEFHDSDLFDVNVELNSPTRKEVVKEFKTTKQYEVFKRVVKHEFLSIVHWVEIIERRLIPTFNSLPYIINFNPREPIFLNTNCAISANKIADTNQNFRADHLINIIFSINFKTKMVIDKGLLLEIFNKLMPTNESKYKNELHKIFSNIYEEMCRLEDQSTRKVNR